ncbi:hypothetical protein PCANB_000119 [Pneumocystis canis]|nr:hypothetical protein PCANB_000119 [Pneumocystis canis]
MEFISLESSKPDIPIISTQDITHSLRNKLEALENQLKTADDLLNGRINVYFPQKEKFLLDWVLDKLKEIKLNKMKSFDILPKLWEFLDTVLKCQSLLIESKCFSFQKYSFIAIFSTSMSLIVEIKNENILYSLASSIVKTLDYILSDEILSLFIQGSFTITTTILANFFYSIINLNLHNDVISTLGSRILKIWEGSIYGLEISSKVLPHICYLLGKEDTPSWVNDMFSIILGKTLFSVESLIGYLNFQIPDSKSKETTLKISDLGLFFDFLLNNLTDISHHSNVLLSLPRLFEIAQNSLNRDLLYSKRKINLNPSKITQLSDIFFLEILRLAINLCVEDDAFKYMIISNIIKMSRNNNGHYKSFNIIMEQQISEVLKKSFILIKNKNVYNEQLWLSLSQIDMSITEIKKIDPKVTFYMIQCQLVYLQYFDRENPEKFKIKDISLSINLILDHIIFSLENLPTNSSWEAGKMQSINSTNINLVYIYMINNQWMHLINKFSFFDKIKKIMDIFLKCSIENILEEINVSQTLTFSNLWYIYLSNAEIYELNLFGNVCLSTLMDYVFSIKFDKLLFRNDIKSYFNKQASENIIRKKNSNLDILKFKKITKYIQIIPINCIKDSIKGKLLDFLFYVDFQFTIKQYFTDMQLVENRKLLYRIMTTTNKLDSMQNEYEFCIPGIIQLLLILFSEIQDTSKDIDDSLKKNITKLLKFYFKDIKKCLKILIQNYHKNTLDLKKIPNSIYLFRFFFQLSFSMSFKSYNKDLLKKLIFLISMSCFYYDNIDICLHKKSQDSLLFLLKIFCNKAENYDDILEICVTLIAVFKNMELFFMDHVKISNCDLESLSIYHFIEQRLQNLEFQDFKKISIILCYSLWEKKDINIVSNILCSILLSRAEKDSELQEEYTKLFQSIVSHLILIAKKTTDLEILYNFINLFNILLLEKSLYFSLQNLDQLFVIIVTSLSPSSKIINLSSNITIDDISKGFCKMISLILKKNYKKLYRRYHLLINCFQSLLHLFIFDTNTKMTKNNSFQRRPNWILASTSCSISAAKVYSDSLLYWIHILHLNKDIKKLKLGLSKTSEKIISKYLLWIIIEYIKLLLYYSINNEIKDILTPSIMEILKILSKYELEMINNALDNQGKTIFKKLYDNYMKYDKWNEA